MEDQTVLVSGKSEMKFLHNSDISENSVGLSRYRLYDNCIWNFVYVTPYYTSQNTKFLKFLAN